MDGTLIELSMTRGNFHAWTLEISVRLKPCRKYNPDLVVDFILSAGAFDRARRFRTLDDLRTTCCTLLRCCGEAADAVDLADPPNAVSN